MDQTQGVRVLIDRLGLPPRLKLLVASIEEKDGPIENPADPGLNEIRTVRGMVDGENLLACIVACLLNHVDIPEDVEAEFAASTAPQRSLYIRWQELADEHPDALVLMLVDGVAFVAFDSQATRLADELEEHTVNLERRVGVSLGKLQQLDWAQRLVDKGVTDVLLIEPGSEPVRIGDVYDATTGDALDHDNDGKPGGSVAGEQSTASKGRRRKRAAA